MKKYTVIHKDGSTEIINAKSAVKDAIAEGNIVINEEFEVLNPVLLTPDCDGKFAILSSESVPYSISYYPHLEKGYAISGYYFDCFGHVFEERVANKGAAETIFQNKYNCLLGLVE